MKCISRCPYTSFTKIFLFTDYSATNRHIHKGEPPILFPATLTHHPDLCPNPCQTHFECDLFLLRNVIKARRNKCTAYGCERSSALLTLKLMLEDEVDKFDRDEKETVTRPFSSYLLKSIITFHDEI